MEKKRYEIVYGVFKDSEIKCIIDNKETIGIKFKNFGGFELIGSSSNDNKSSKHQVLVLKEQNDSLLSLMCKDLNSNEYSSLETFASKKEKFYNREIYREKEIGDFGELFFVYKNNINDASSMTTNNQTLDISNYKKIEIKTTISLRKIFQIRYPQWKKVHKFAFVSLDKNDSGINILELIKKIKEQNFNKNIEFINKMYEKYKKKKDFQYFLIESSWYRIISKEKLNLPDYFDSSVEECNIKININKIKISK